MMASFFKFNQCRIISPSWVDKCPCACLWECLWCLHTVDAGTCAGTHCDWDHLINVTWSLSTFEADSTCQSALCVECFLDACCHLEGVGCVCMCVWITPPCFLPGKTLLSLLVFPVTSPLPEAQHSCQRQSEMPSWTARWRATKI